MVKNRNKNKKKNSDVAPMDASTAEPGTVSNTPEAMDTTEIGVSVSASNSAHRLDKNENRFIQNKDGLRRISDKLQESRLGRFEHVQSRRHWAPIRRCKVLTLKDLRRSRGRTKKSLLEVIRQDLSLLSLSDYTAVDKDCGSQSIEAEKVRGVQMKRTKSARKKKALLKAISRDEKTSEGVSKKENKKTRVKLAKTLYE